MYFSLTKLLLLGAILSRATAQDDDDDDDDGGDEVDNGFGALDQGIAQLDTSHLCDMILNQCPGGFPASSCPSPSLPCPI